jgi:hypothetical protein
MKKQALIRTMDLNTVRCQTRISTQKQSVWRWCSILLSRGFAPSLSFKGKLTKKLICRAVELFKIDVNTEKFRQVCTPLTASFQCISLRVK